MDEVDIERAKIVAIIEEKYRKKPKIEPIKKVWVKEEIDVTDIKPKKHEPKHKPKPEVKNTLF